MMPGDQLARLRTARTTIRPNVDDAQIAAGADLFLVNGLGLDDFVTKVVNNSGNKNVKIFKVAETALPAKEGPRLHLANTSTNKEPAGTTTNTSANGTRTPGWASTRHPDGQADLRYTENSRSCSRRRLRQAGGRIRPEAGGTPEVRQDKLAGKQNRKLIAMHDSLVTSAGRMAWNWWTASCRSRESRRTTPNWLNWSRPAPMRVSASLP